VRAISELRSIQPTCPEVFSWAMVKSGNAPGSQEMKAKKQMDLAGFTNTEGLTAESRAQEQGQWMIRVGFMRGRGGLGRLRECLFGCACQGGSESTAWRDPA
jgi:hypothetical protein